MDRFLLDNAALYQTLVKGLGPKTVPQNPSGVPGATSPDMVVSARIRPLLHEDVAAGFPCAIFPRSTHTGVVDIHDLYNHPRGRPILKSFNYEVDRLFNAQTTTEEIYETLVVDLVPFAWNGGVGTLFSYGQTGSGKTFTVSRLEQLVAGSLTDGSLGGQRQLYITIIDLAGNSAFDLLDSRKSISILEDSFGVTQLAGANEHLVRSRDEVMELVERAASFRRTAPTLRNDDSSRSHGICRIRIHNKITDSDGLLYLVDLAGSEAARDVAVHGADRMRETRDINMSLSVLKDCIRGKAQSDLLSFAGSLKSKQRKPHVPFRQSALTKILKHVFDPSENRACKTIVIACLNPSLADVGPSKNTLRYAETLRVLIPATDKKEPNPIASKAYPRNSTKLNKNLGQIELANRITSRDPDPSAVEVPFRERVRPGMIVSWKKPLEDHLTLNAPDGFELAAVLCPSEAFLKTTGNGLENMMNPAEKNNSGTKNDDVESKRYSCALLTPVAMAGAYELNLWEQVIIDVSMMEKEIILEYNAETRYYHVSV